MVSFLFLVKGLTRIISNHELPPRTGQRKLMETAAIGTRISSTRGTPDWENYPWHGDCRVELEPIVGIPAGPGWEERGEANKREEGGWVNTFP